MTEISLYSHMKSAYRHIENMTLTNSGALKKRSGTKLALFSDKEIYIFSTKESTHIFIEDGTYKVIKNTDFSVLKPVTQLPTELTFSLIKDGNIQETALSGGETRLILSTDAGVFLEDSLYDFVPQNLIDLPTGVSPRLFLILSGRSLIAYENTLYFSRYNEIFNFKTLPPDDPNSPTAAYYLEFAVGIDNQIIDLIYFRKFIFVGTPSSIYQIQYFILNPFSDFAQLTQDISISKIFSDGIATRNFSSSGNFVLFANNRGIFAIQVLTTILTTTRASTSSVVSLTENMEHILSEDEYTIVDIVSYFRRENVFFVQRSDGIIFKCVLSLQKQESLSMKVTRYIAGEIGESRQYTQLESQARFFVTRRGNTYYLESSEMYPYLRDNRAIYSWHNDIQNLRKFAFLDCYQNFSNFILQNATRLTTTTIETQATLVVDKQYYFWDKIGEFYGSFKVLSKNGSTYTISIEIQNDVFVLGQRLQIKDIDLTFFQEYREGQKLYLTYVDLNYYPLRTNTIEIVQGTNFDSFMAVVGFGYSGSLEVFFNFSNVKNVVAIERIHYFSCEKMDFKAYTREGVPRETSTGSEIVYSNTIRDLNLPTIEYEYYENCDVRIPTGFSGCILQLSTIS